MLGAIAIVSRAAMIGLNVIVNASQLGAAQTALRQGWQGVAREFYTQLAWEAYKQQGASGSGLTGGLHSWEGRVKLLLRGLKSGLVDELKRKGAARYVPGVNIIIGLSEDSLAFFSTAAMVSDGDREVQGIIRKVSAQIFRMEQELMKLGIQANEQLTLAQIKGRTA